MITEIINKYDQGDISLEDAIVEAEQIRKQLEAELDFLKDFKYRHSVSIERLSKELPDGHKGFLFEVRKGRVTYDFKGVKQWEFFNKQKQDYETKLKTILKAKINGAIHANVTEDGEEIELPKIKYGKSSVVLKQIK